MANRGRGCISTLALFLILSIPTHAGSHAWVVNEIFTNDDGTVQFVELYCPPAFPNEVNLSGKSVTALLGVTIHAFTENLTLGTTADKYILLATPAFAALPGAPTPDHLIAPRVLRRQPPTVEQIKWYLYNASILSYTAVQLPKDGLLSLSQSGLNLLNSPTNFAGQSGSVDASGSDPPPPVPAGEGGSTPMTVAKSDPLGNSLELAWDIATCAGAAEHQILYGQGSDLPNGPGGIYAPAGSVCTIGGATPFSWNNTPSANDGKGLIWWILAVTDSSTEGSWGLDSGSSERNGPGLNGSSAECGITDKDVSNSCH